MYLTHFSQNTEYSKNIFSDTGNYSVRGISRSTRLYLYALTALLDNVEKRQVFIFLFNVVMPYLAINNSHSFGEYILLLVSMNQFNNYINLQEIQSFNNSLWLNSETIEFYKKILKNAI